jgi:hypothetical protein
VAQRRDRPTKEGAENAPVKGSRPRARVTSRGASRFPSRQSFASQNAHVRLSRTVPAEGAKGASTGGAGPATGTGIGEILERPVHVVIRRHIVMRWRLRKKPALPSNPSQVAVYSGSDVPGLLIVRGVTPSRANNYAIRRRGPISTRAERRHLLTGWATDPTLGLRHRRQAARLLLWMGGRCSCEVCTVAAEQAPR